MVKVAQVQNTIYRSLTACHYINYFYCRRCSQTLQIYPQPLSGSIHVPVLGIFTVYHLPVYTVIQSFSIHFCSQSAFHFGISFQPYLPSQALLLLSTSVLYNVLVKFSFIHVLHVLESFLSTLVHLHKQTNISIIFSHLLLHRQPSIILALLLTSTSISPSTDTLDSRFLNFLTFSISIPFNLIIIGSCPSEILHLITSYSSLYLSRIFSSLRFP